MVLPFVLVFMLLLTNDRELMGDHVNSRSFNIIAWVTVVVMIVLTLALVITQIGSESHERLKLRSLSSRQSRAFTLP